MTGTGGRRRPAWLLVAALLALLLVGWSLGELARATAQTTDLSAVREMAADRTATLTSIAKALSLLGSGYVVFPLTLACAVALYAIGRRATAAFVGLSLIGTVVIANTDKLLVDRPRPPVHHLEAVTSPSFPSGHASQSTALFLALLLTLLAVHRPRAWGAVSVCATVLLVAAIAWSRIYLGVHYPTDVAAGILLATAWTLTAKSSLLHARPDRPRKPGPQASRVNDASSPEGAPAGARRTDEELFPS